MGSGGDEYGASLSFLTSSGASNAGSSAGGGGGGTKYQVVTGNGGLASLASFTPKQLWPILAGGAAVA